MASSAAKLPKLMNFSQNLPERNKRIMGKENWSKNSSQYSIRPSETLAHTGDYCYYSL